MSFLGRRIRKANEIERSPLSCPSRRLFAEPTALPFDEKLFVNEAKCERQKGDTGNVTEREQGRLFGDCVSLYAVIEHLNSSRCNSVENRLCDELAERYKRLNIICAIDEYNNRNRVAI